MAPAYLISIASLRITYVYFKSTNGLLPSKNPVKLIQFVKGCLANWCPRYQLSISSWVKSMQLGESNWKRTMKWLWWLNWRNSNRWDEVVQTSAGCYPPHLHLLSYFWPRSARRPPPPLCQTDALPLQRKHNNNNSVAVTKESIHPSIQWYHPVNLSGWREVTLHTQKKKKAATITTMTFKSVKSTVNPDGLLADFQSIPGWLLLILCSLNAADWLRNCLVSCWLILCWFLYFFSPWWISVKVDTARIVDTRANSLQNGSVCWDTVWRRNKIENQKRKKIRKKKEQRERKENWRRRKRKE